MLLSGGVPYDDDDDASPIIMYQSYIYIQYTLTSSFVLYSLYNNRRAKAKDTRCLVGSTLSGVELDEEQKKKDEEENDDDNEAAKIQHLIGGKTSSEDSDRGGTVAFANGMDAAAG